MPQYLLNIHQPDGPAPAPELLGPVMERVHQLVQDAQAKRVFLFQGGLHAPSASSVVRVQHNELTTTDGPYVEGKEHVGGFMVIEVSDLDAALSWAGRLAQALQLEGRSDSLAIEVRPFQHLAIVGRP